MVTSYRNGYQRLCRFNNKQSHFSYTEDISVREKPMIVGQLAVKCSRVVFTVSCWHKKIASGLLAVSISTANKIRLNKFLRREQS